MQAVYEVSQYMAPNDLLALRDDKFLIEDIRQLSRVDNWKSTCVLVQQWLVIAVAIAVAVIIDRWWFYIASIVVVAAKQHALAVIVHDATHYRLFTSRSANEYLGNALCAFPIFISVQGYRGEHQQHHMWTNTHEDPYLRMFDQDSAWQWPKTTGQALWQIFTDVTGLNTLRNLRLIRRWAPFAQWLKQHQNPQLNRRLTIDVLYYLIFWATIFSSLIFFGIWKMFMLLWVLPALTFYVLFTRLRWISEHPYGSSKEIVFKTRHIEGTNLERFFIAPLNVNYHIAHHLFPTVPLFNLPEAHNRLLQHPSYREEAQRYLSYLGLSDSLRAELIVD
jgi:fatty acid desaturase